MDHRRSGKARLGPRGVESATTYGLGPSGVNLGPPRPNAAARH
jgi:hypothetical protein